MIGARAAAGTLRVPGAPYLFGALGGFLFGYDNGGIAGALLFIRHSFALSSAMTGIVVSALVLGAFLSAGIAGRLTHRFGSRRLLMVAGAVLSLGSAGAALAPDVAALVVARLVIGAGIGIATVQVPVYLAEMAPTAARGALTALFQVMVATGILVAYLVSYTLSGSGAWRLMLGLAVLPSLLLLGGMALQPESPRWLCRRGRVAEARATLLRGRDAAEAERELADMVAAGSAPGPGLGRLLREAATRRALLVATGLSVLQQLTGITTITYYAPSIFRAAGFGDAAAILTAVGLGGLTLLCTVASSLVVDRLGRRPLMIAGALLMALGMAVLCALFRHGAAAPGLVPLAVLCIALFKAAFALSWGPLVWVLLPEVLPSTIRGTGMGVATSVNWIASLAVIMVFPVMLEAGPAVLYAAFAGVALLAALFVRAQVPETAGRSLERIERAT